MRIFNPQTKHIALKYHHFCSHVKNGHIEISYCPTEDQKADLLTKPLADLMILAYLGQTPEVPRTDLRAKHHS